MAQAATNAFDLETLRRGVEGRDADVLSSLFAEDAELIEIDKDHPPNNPQVFRGRSEIAEHLRDVASREMTHRLERPIVDDRRLAFTEACRYPDGMNVLCMASADLDAEHRIVRQTAVTAWDG